jgi:hypothetical protein
MGITKGDIVLVNFPLTTLSRQLIVKRLGKLEEQYLEQLNITFCIRGERPFTPTENAITDQLDLMWLICPRV